MCLSAFDNYKSFKSDRWKGNNGTHVGLKENEMIELSGRAAREVLIRVLIAETVERCVVP